MIIRDPASGKTIQEEDSNLKFRNTVPLSCFQLPAELSFVVHVDGLLLQGLLVIPVQQVTVLNTSHTDKK
jgi:hypothetical protein